MRVPERGASLAEAMQIMQAATFIIRRAVLLHSSLGVPSLAPGRHAFAAIQSCFECNLLELPKEMPLWIALFVGEYPFRL